jgi:epoxyqueuosine reductase
MKPMSKPGLLLHVCCAPCATHVFNVLARDYAVTGCFYNPNIHPPKEYAMRLASAEQHCRGSSLPLIVPEYRPRDWFSFVKGLEPEPEGGARCARCIQMRLDETARTAAALGFSRFGTTLTVSPHKNAALVNRLGEESGARHGVRFYTADFKKGDGYGESCRISRALGLYRQRHCGCIFSVPARGVHR